ALTCLIAGRPAPAAEICRSMDLDQAAVVFGVTVCTHPDMDGPAVGHVIAVASEYLDNDEDGKPDDPKVAAALAKARATLLVVPDEDAFEIAQGGGAAKGGPEPVLQPVFADDIVSGGAARGEFDATLEEVLHVITQAGYARAYPDVFGARPGTAIADAMDAARGGRFPQVPAHYPDGAWFTYDDETCAYDCMVAEYFYWALTSLLGGQDFPGRPEEIAPEWRAPTPAAMREIDHAGTALLTDPARKLPRRLPDGRYTPR
ncbi:MAG: hypothetical protein VW405_13840, partial [Rhodospirillaceae bacterium]